MKWMEALKQYNSGKGMWCVPKKGTPEYFDVRALMHYDTAKDIEARNVERREKSVAQLREATKGMKPGVRVDAPVKAPAKAPASGGAGGSDTSFKHISPELAEAFRNNAFIQKAYGGKDTEEFLRDVDKVLDGKGQKVREWTESYGVPVYELGEFFSRQWPKNANNLNVRKQKGVEALMNKLPGGKWVLQSVTTGDSEAYGRYEDIVMTIMKYPME